jgi:hypothetical protein
MYQSRLYSHTRDLLINRPASISLKQVSDDTGIQVRNLQYIVRGKSKSPNVNTVERLYVYLSGKPLNLGA